MNSKLVKSNKAPESAQLTLYSFEEQTTIPRGIGLRKDVTHKADHKENSWKPGMAGVAVAGVFAAIAGTVFTVAGIISNAGEFAIVGTDIVVVVIAAIWAVGFLFGEWLNRQTDKVFHPVSEEKLDKLEKEIMEGKFSAAPIGKCNGNSK
ncbi:MAG: hypothetical protein M1559_02125 [Candidatus Marsarchaeota archaeon]|nr:hypothetical protein [Candidatus Marsarchaeota archaeon]